ncbi:polyribonucleotide nucleotidyltransferase [Candidatus Daviesbacteria bacterium]|nr:polyribonucleotide nucleotidyltransferase [Candidatus Daviesbacteria bacterium]
MNKLVVKEIDFNGRKLKLETGKLAQMANSAVMATLGDTVVLATVSTKPAQEGMDYFPLSVEYVEKYYAGGRITAQKFIKREARPTERAILAGRAIDRAIRPFFPKDFKNEVQVILTVLSFDGVNDPGLLGFITTSAALSISTIPWAGPLGVIRIGKLDGKIVVSPDMVDLDKLELDLTVAASRDKIAMVEAEAKQVSDEEVFEAIKQGHQEAQIVIDLIEDFAKAAGQEKQPYSTVTEEVEEAVLAEVKKLAHEQVVAALFDQDHPWHEATGQMIKEELALKYADVLTPQIISGVFDKVAKEIMNDAILVKKQRVDNRAMDEVRPIIIETSILPRTHGSALFQRGDTQVLSVVTLGPTSAAQTLEGMEGEGQKRFMHHYNMSINPFATGEVKRIGAPNRRDIGHGDLVERAILGVLPTEEEFPYAIRVVSEVLGANASTSQAAVCASTLALMNAGVPIKEPVAGIAMGLLSNDKTFQVITDMRAVEDFYGEMDFKVAGTLNGITAIQMDTKLQGISFEIAQQALNQGKAARESIIGKIKEAIPAPQELSKYAPKIEVTHIKPEDIGTLIGSGGKTINGIIAKTGAQIDIEDDGTVMVSSTSEESIKQALSTIENMFKEVMVGEEYDAKVVRLADFGAFAEILPGRDGLIHISQMAPGRVEKPEDIVKEGQIVHVRVTDVDSTTGKVGLSMLFGADIKPESEGRPQARGRGFSGGGRAFGSTRGGGFGGARPSFGPRRDSRGGFGGGSRSDRSGQGSTFSRPRDKFGGPKRPFGNSGGIRRDRDRF